MRRSKNKAGPSLRYVSPCIFFSGDICVSSYCFEIDLIYNIFVGFNRKLSGEN